MPARNQRTHTKKKSKTARGSGKHHACTVHLFYLDDLLVLIVLLGCCPLRCCVAELVPHFTVNTVIFALYMLCLTRHANTRAYEPQKDLETACWDACSALLQDRLCVPLFLV